jgi:hypothetical protein
MATPGHGAHPQFDHDLVWQGVSVSGSPVPIRIVPNGLISRLEPASSWADLLAQAEDLQNLARNRRDPSFRFTGGARECEVDASQTQLDGREMPPLTEASRDATQALISTIKSDSTSCWEFSGLRSALLGSPTTHAFPVPPALPGEDDVESVAEPFFGLSGASDVMFFPFSGPLIFPSGAGRHSRCTESFQAGKIVFGPFRRKGLRAVPSLQVCRTRPTLAHNRLRYRV